MISWQATTTQTRVPSSSSSYSEEFTTSRSVTASAGPPIIDAASSSVSTYSSASTSYSTQTDGRSVGAAERSIFVTSQTGQTLHNTVASTSFTSQNSGSTLSLFSTIENSSAISTSSWATSYFTRVESTANSTGAGINFTQSLSSTASSSGSTLKSDTYNINTSTTRTTTSAGTTTTTTTQFSNIRTGNSTGGTQTTNVTVTRTTSRTTAYTYNQTTTSSSTTSTGISPFFRVSGWMPGGGTSRNEWLIYKNSTFEGIGFLSQGCDTYDGSFLAIPTFAGGGYYAAGTSSLPTSTTDSSGGTNLIDSSVNVSNVFGFTTRTITVTTAVSSSFTRPSMVLGSVRPFTAPSTVTTSLLTTTTSTFTDIGVPGTTFAVGNTYSLSSARRRTITFTRFTAHSTYSFSYLTTATHGWETFTTSSYNAPANSDRLVNTGHSFTSTFSSSVAGATTVSARGSTFAGGKAFQVVLTIQSAITGPGTGNGQFIGGIPNISLWQKSFQSPQAALAPATNLTQSPGTNIGPAFASDYIIPATYRQRADGPQVPLPNDGTTILTFLRNTSGGFGTSRASSLWTTFSWNYSLNSLSITTQSSSLNGTEPVIVSSSTSVILTEAGTPSLLHNLFSTFQKALVAGGFQKADSATLQEGRAGLRETTYDTDGNSGEGSRSVGADSFRTIDIEAILSVMEETPIISCNTQFQWANEILQGGAWTPISAPRNLANNP